MDKKSKSPKDKTQRSKKKNRKQREPSLNIKTAETHELHEEFSRLKTAEMNKPGKDIKNKQKRQELVMKRAQRKKQIKTKIRKNNQKLRKEQGDYAVPKIEVKTIDNQRENDETYIDKNDEELIEELQVDEFSSYFNGDYEPSIMITTSIRYTSSIFKFIKAMKDTVPNLYFYYRKKQHVEDLIEFAKSKDFSTLIIVTERVKQPYRLTVAHLLGEGITYEFKISNVVYRDEIKGAAAPSEHYPELVMNNFKTKLGSRVERLLRSLFPKDENLIGRRVVTFHNQRDFIFFRHHRYIFEDDFDGVRLQEIGPRFNLRLLSIQKGLFDKDTGDYEWYYKDKMGVRRRKFYL